jgi:hypothetical protein
VSEKEGERDDESARRKSQCEQTVRFINTYPLSMLIIDI